MFYFYYSKMILYMLLYFDDECKLDKHISSHFLNNDDKQLLFNDSLSQFSTYQNENKNNYDEKKNSLNCNEIFEMLEKDLNKHNINFNCFDYKNKYNDENDLFEMEIGKLFSC